VLGPQTPAEHVSVVQGLPSLQSEPLQHCWQAVPQSFGVAGAQPQAPLEQIAPDLQGVPQPPQCFESVFVSTSQSAGLASQFAKPAAHCGLPATHTWFCPTALAQLPQFWGSVCKSTQDAPHRVSAPHPAVQLVPSHAGVVTPHDVVHEPQCVGSVAAVSQPGAVPSQSR
jgi:hypothetical protein